MNYTTDQFLGEGIKTEYKDIMPIINLVLYRVSFFDSEGIFSYDYYNKSNVMDLFKNAYRLFFYCAYKVKNFVKSDKREKTLVSDTLLNSDRYKDARDEMIKNYPIAGIMQIGTIAIRHQFRRAQKDLYDVRTVFAGNSLCGARLKKTVHDIYQYFVKVLEEETVCETSQIVPMFENLSRQWKKATARIERLISNNNISLFVTTNQYNLRDRMIILTCNRIGVGTKELAHSMELILGTNFNKKFELVARDIDFNYVRERCLWCDYDVEYSRKYCSYDVNYSVVGCPEIIRKGELLKENLVTVMMPSRQQMIGMHNSMMYPDKFYDEEITYKKKLLEKVKIFADNNSLRVWIKYHPFDASITRDEDKEICDRYGFKVLDDGHDAFDEAIRKSKVVIGSATTSSLVVAAFMDCEAYNISAGDDIDYCGFPINAIDFEELETIRTKGDYRYPYSCEFNIEKLLSF